MKTSDSVQRNWIESEECNILQDLTKPLLKVLYELGKEGIQDD